MTDILATPLSIVSKDEDYIRWKESKDGKFIIKTSYSLLLKSECADIYQSSTVSWKLMWKIRAPFKYRMLMWNCVHEILPVAASLSQYIDTIYAQCSRCSSAPETHLHLFRDCWESSILWSYIFKRVKNAKEVHLNSFFRLDWTGWINYNLSLSMDWKVVFIVAIWHIWKARNREVFDLKMIKPFSVYNTFYVNYMDTNTIMQAKAAGNWLQKSPTWKPPAAWFIDGSWKERDEA
ncbi:uncharacterized protein [Spinacia oleracea]|uniref:Reverse transcriptase zinc-binding domain-containing protein n=1 Tax=Spinacia oleracea TaxID=3562 RepID=A0A9R0IP61_SPIOL|nr:uncharacterized protein LOC110792403 [Spinacia oleracea]